MLCKIHSVLIFLKFLINTHLFFFFFFFCFQGMLVPILLILYVSTYVNGKLCDKNQFWSQFLERCEDCAKCTHPDIVLRPCQVSIIFQIDPTFFLLMGGLMNVRHEDCFFDLLKRTLIRRCSLKL